MAEFTLRAATPLGGIRRDYANLTIEEVTGRALVSVAARREALAGLDDAMQSAFTLHLPEPGRSSHGPDGMIALGMGVDQFFLLFNDPGSDPTVAIRRNIASAAYIIDQSDGWAMVRLTGANARPALERICPLDLDSSVFPPGRVARTVMEHLSVILLCEAANQYILMSPRSSAGSFLHALETSARNVE